MLITSSRCKPLFLFRSALINNDHKRTIGRHRQVLTVKRCSAGTDAAAQLQMGDMLLAAGGRTVFSFRDVDLAVEECEEQACAEEERQSGGEARRVVELTVFRSGKGEGEGVVTLRVAAARRSTLGTARVVQWAGLLLQPPHLAVCNLGFLPEEGRSGGVYCSRWSYGSPAHKYGLRATCWITEVNGARTPDLDTFLAGEHGNTLQRTCLYLSSRRLTRSASVSVCLWAVVRRLPDCASVRLMTMDLTGKTCAMTLKTDHHYWPTMQLRGDTAGWHLAAVEHSSDEGAGD